MAELVELHRARLVYGVLLAKKQNRAGKNQKHIFLFLFYNAIVTNQRRLSSRFPAATEETSTAFAKPKPWVRIFIVNNNAH